MIYRTQEEIGRTIDDMKLDIDIEWIKEDPECKDTRDLTDPGFFERYKHEARVIDSMMDVATTKVLELGSGPGTLAQMIMDLKPTILDYHLVDGEGARQVHEKREYKGKFFVKDLEHYFHTEGLDTNYDFIILDDFLEHIKNPSIILEKCHDMLIPSGKLFVSIPNWRMGHAFFYPGLFDFDNFLKFLAIHKFEPCNIGESNMKVALRTDRLQCEEMVDEKMLFDWNWYILAERK